MPDQSAERVQAYGRRCLRRRVHPVQPARVPRCCGHPQRRGGPGGVRRYPGGPGGCPWCGVVSTRVHQRTTQRVRDVPFDGLVTLWWVRERWRCTEPLCGRATFTEHTEQVPPYARLTTRLKARIVAALAGEVRCVDAVAAELGVSWPTAMRQLTAAMAAQAARTRARPVLVHSLGSMSTGSGRCAGTATSTTPGGGSSRG